MAASEAQQKLQELHATLNADLEKTRRELNELDTLLRQTNSEVEKLAQRELTVANRLRDLEVNLDKYSKADVKNFFTSAQEVQMRLLMMRGQLEQLALAHLQPLLAKLKLLKLTAHHQQPHLHFLGRCVEVLDIGFTVFIDVNFQIA